MKAPLHPNGFRVRLLIEVFGFRLRLHWWPTDAKRLDSPHDHRSWFISLPLWGKFVEHRYAESTVGETFSILDCDPKGGNGSPTCTAGGIGILRRTITKIRRAFVPYYCPAGAIHSFLPMGPSDVTPRHVSSRYVTRQKWAASLVLFGRARRRPRAWTRRV